MTVTKQDRLAYSEKAQAIVDQMTLEEKVYLMSGRMSFEQLMEDIANGHHYNWYPYPAGGNDRLGVPEMKFVDGPRGAVSGNSTCFPVSMARGATFDKDLEQRIGRAIGKEIRAHGGNLFGGVCVNLPRNPGWGRSQEVYGEDSFHLGAMGAALTKGVQEENVIACVKHYAFNSMENARFKVSVEADKRTEREVYLPHFKDCIDAGAASVMSAYNLYKGTYAGHNDYLLNRVLKEEWNFDGFVISDFIWGVKDTVEAANGGMDIEMCHTKYFGDHLVEAVKSGKVNEEKVNQAVLRIVRTLLAFTEADDKKYGKELIGNKEHIELALEAAEKSMTLMKNNNNTLPFSKTDVKQVAVIGKLGDKGNIGDHGSSRVFPDYIVTPLEGIKSLLPEVEVVYHDGADIEGAKQLAKSSDAVVFVVGYNHDDEGEFINNPDEDVDARGGGDTGFGAGGDRKTSLGLHKEEIELVRAVGPENNQSAAVLIGGNTIMIEDWKQDVSAILMAYYPGMEGGTALARTLFGDVNPSGKLPFVLPKQESDLPQVDWDASKIKYEYYHGYAKLDKEGVEPSLPYGFGLSYTTFKISNPEFSTKNDQVVASCEVENTGEREGAEVVQLYVGYGNSSIDRPVKVLRGFERVILQPGEKQKVEITCPVDKLKFYNPETNQWELEEIDYEVYIGTSSDEKDLLEGTLTFESVEQQ
ncbi:glycoside hydrolase family 3 C-terminal domain-containing protein [Sediminibacillus massiliensis]|uniref:glycoside hydrolase family 3 C-terminal domain-containing protein n=1 Tax=Sediminibacillus massiliensis TaxID=1926277 RepID=UPI00098857D2|nr:glycoside hydrolase family 3 C-terminal domain-containing protein [Sediminibacillus massiliensis]